MLTISPNPLLLDREQRELASKTVLRRQSGKRRMVSALQARNAVRDIAELPALEESLHCVCRGNFPLWSIVPASPKLAAPATITALYLATLGFSSSNAADLFELMDAGQIKTVAIVASVFFQRQNPKEYGMMDAGIRERGQRLVALRSHAKVIAFSLSDGRQFAVESSANLRSCRNLEQFSFTQSPSLYQFHRDWIEQVISAAGKGAR
ncbi:MAG TPA: hypothetical protein VH370_20485 [Humisphaera sp.]|jgi:hypothetical protein|nr:hypothetical protein [Humisphaera sp.]